VAYLFLMWPLPVQYVLSRWLDSFTSWSISAVALVTRLVPVASADRAVPGSFRITGPAGTFPMVVATECSGANGLLGFLLIAVPTAVIAVGPRRRKAAWLAVGAAVIWSLNVVRILLVFTAGRLWGERVAVDGFHPYVGLVTFVGGTVAMVWLMPRFGLRFRLSARGERPAADDVHSAVPRWRGPAVWLLVVAALLGVLDAGLKSVDPVASALGAPELLPFASSSRRLAGFDTSVVPVDGLDTLATRYFGADGTWIRYSVDSTGAAHLGADLPVYADVVTTSDAGTFDDFGIEACYRFHGYDVDGRSEVDLGAGQVGTLLSWKDPRSVVRYTTLYWYWPVALAGTTRFQRIVLLIPSNAGGRVWSPDLPSRLVSQLGIAIDERLQGRPGGEPGRRDRQLRQYLVGLARQLVVASKREGVR
jgi:exosortase/archaeosortase family protein